MHTITLYRTTGGWLAEHSDPRIAELFGSDILPTAYTAQASRETVETAIQRLNPGCRIFVRDERGGAAVSQNLVNVPGIANALRRTR